KTRGTHPESAKVSRRARNYIRFSTSGTAVAGVRKGVTGHSCARVRLLVLDCLASPSWLSVELSAFLRPSGHLPLVFLSRPAPGVKPLPPKNLRRQHTRPRGLPWRCRCCSKIRMARTEGPILPNGNPSSPASPQKTDDFSREERVRSGCQESCRGSRRLHR